MNSTHTDVVVLGAGVIGLSCALSLLKRGRSVTVVDAGRVGGGSSHGNCGTLTPSHAPPLAAPGVIAKALCWMVRPDAPLAVRPGWNPALWYWLARAALRCNLRDWQQSARGKAALLNASRNLFPQRLADEEIDCEFAESGLVYVFRSEAGMADILASLPTLNSLGVEAEVWNAERLCGEEPGLRADCAGGVFFPGDAQLRPDRYVAGLADAVRRRGGRIEEYCAADGLRDEVGRVEVVCGERRFTAGQVVMALGAWSPQLAGRLGLRLPIQPGKGYSMTYEPQPGLAPRHALVLKEKQVCVTGWGSGFRLGSTMEFSGYDSRLNRTRLDALTRAAGEYLREPLAAKPLEEWYGWRPMTWDDLPIIGAMPGRPRVFAAAGHGMMGVSMSPATGELLAALACGEQPPLDPMPYSPARFR